MAAVHIFTWGRPGNKFNFQYRADRAKELGGGRTGGDMPKVLKIEKGGEEHEKE